MGSHGSSVKGGWRGKHFAEVQRRRNRARVRRAKSRKRQYERVWSW